MPLVTLTTDFGHHDAFVGIMKGVILNLAPDATLVDLCHLVPPQDVLAGAMILDSAIDVFPEGAIHVAVVDPGVGTARRALAIDADRFTLIAPDNGLASLVLQRHPARRIVALENTAYFSHPLSATFHGRDVFASVAGHLAAGVRLADLGPTVLDPVTLDFPRPVLLPDGSTQLHIVRIDHFGNLITDLGQQPTAALARTRFELRIGTTVIDRLSRTYSDVAPGSPLAYLGSAGRLELAVREGNAASAWGVGVGATVLLRQG